VKTKIIAGALAGAVLLAGQVAVSLLPYQVADYGITFQALGGDSSSLATMRIGTEDATVLVRVEHYVGPNQVVTRSVELRDGAVWIDGQRGMTADVPCGSATCRYVGGVLVAVR